MMREVGVDLKTLASINSDAMDMDKDKDKDKSEGDKDAGMDDE